jgi:hypothetical protein
MKMHALEGSRDLVNKILIPLGKILSSLEPLERIFTMQKYLLHRIDRLDLAQQDNIE